MSKEQENKAIIGRWFTSFWGPKCDLSIVDELAAPDMLLQYSLHEPRRGHDDIRAFMTDFRAAFAVTSTMRRFAILATPPPRHRAPLTKLLTAGRACTSSPSRAVSVIRTSCWRLAD